MCSEQVRWPIGLTGRQAASLRPVYYSPPTTHQYFQLLSLRPATCLLSKGQHAGEQRLPDITACIKASILDPIAPGC